MYGIVEQAGGHITVDSEPDQGTTFRVYLPRVNEQPAVEEHAQATAPGKGHETILLVEDESGIRTMTQAYLQSLGYKVLEAANGPEALTISRNYKGQIHLLLSDILMPGMRGDELVRKMRAERPGILALFISGYANAHELEADIQVIEKPFTFPDLGRTIRELLDAPAQQAQPCAS